MKYERICVKAPFSFYIRTLLGIRLSFLGPDSANGYPLLLGSGFVKKGQLCRLITLTTM
jgi:hypothetical protein